MRSDMSKVLVERPRRGNCSNSARYKRINKSETLRAAADPERFDAPDNWEKIRPFWRMADRKELNENLKPLWRFLKSCEGRPWNEVYSEIRKHLSPKSAVQMHVVQHLKSQVSVRTYLGEDGRVYEIPHYGNHMNRDVCLEEPTTYSYRFYVHPVTHEFCASPVTAKRVKKKKTPTKVQVSPLRQYRLINESWYVVEFDKIPRREGARAGYGITGKLYQASVLERPLDYSKVGDILYPNGLPNYSREYEYGFMNVKAISIRPLGKREGRHIKTLLSAS